MARPTTRTELKTYIRRRLGEPVITVNVTDDQLEERIDDALSFFQDYHYDASERLYLKHQVTPSVLTLSATSGSFQNGESIIGSTANVRGVVVTSNTTSMDMFHIKPARVRLAVGETVTGQTSNATAVITAVSLGDYDNEFLPMANTVLSVSKVVQVEGFGFGGSAGMFSWNYQYMLNDLAGLASGSVIGYQLTRSHLEMLHDMFMGDINVRFNRHANKLFLDIDWAHEIKPLDWVVVEAWCILDPALYADIWGDRFLRDYATALVKQQWGQNLSKYDGVQMPGGITLNGKAIYEDAKNEVKEIEEKMRDRFELPPEFLVM